MNLNLLTGWVDYGTYRKGEKLKTAVPGLIFGAVFDFRQIAKVGNFLRSRRSGQHSKGSSKRHRGWGEVGWAFHNACCWSQGRCVWLCRSLRDCGGVCVCAVSPRFGSCLRSLPPTTHPSTPSRRQTTQPTERRERERATNAVHPPHNNNLR